MDHPEDEPHKPADNDNDYPPAVPVPISLPVPRRNDGCGR